MESSKVGALDLDQVDAGWEDDADDVDAGWEDPGGSEAAEGQAGARDNDLTPEERAARSARAASRKERLRAKKAEKAERQKARASAAAAKQKKSVRTARVESDGPVEGRRGQGGVARDGVESRPPPRTANPDVDSAPRARRGGLAFALIAAVVVVAAGAALFLWAR